MAENSIDPKMKTIIRTFFRGLPEIYTCRSWDLRLADGNPRSFTPPLDTVKRVTFETGTTTSGEGAGFEISDWMDGLRYVRGHRDMLRLPQNSWTAQYAQWLPHDEREIEWLEAFVEVYRYFQPNE